MNNIEASRGHLLTEYAMCEQGTPQEVFENPREERTRQFLSSYSHK